MHIYRSLIEIFNTAQIASKLVKYKLKFTNTVSKYLSNINTKYLKLKKFPY